MGFKSLAIQKRSHEVWMTLGAVKTEFEKFGHSLEAVNKKIQEASFKMDETTRRTRVITRKLKNVESLPENQAGLILKEDDSSQEKASLKDELGQ
jgi:DNA recombination protein RmuC